MPGIDISYNELTDIVTIEGKDYSGDFFRFFADDPMHGDDRVFKLRETKGGVITVSVIKDRVISAEFDRCARPAREG